jgi:hypothetical protein
MDQPLGTNSLSNALSTLGALLEQRDLSFEAVAIGGSGLLLLGISVRPTRDLDLAALVIDGRYVSADPLPQDLRQAVEDVAAPLGLPPDWLNAGPTSVLDFGLPEGFESRVVRESFGGLTLHVASRLDQIHLKFYAAVDDGPHSKHFSDLQLLDPTQAELIQAALWCLTHDPSDGFRSQMRGALRALGVSDDEINI